LRLRNRWVTAQSNMHASSSSRGRAHLAYGVERYAHPIFLSGALGLWWVMGRSDDAVLVALVLALSAMYVLERLVPAYPDWHQSGREKLRLAAVVFLLLVLSQIIISSYRAIAFPAFSQFRASTGFDVWPSHWPAVIQILMLYFSTDFVYYWIHRSIHRSPLVWRLSGHGVHHAFHNLHAINFGASHPFELFLLALPMVLIAGVFGAPAEAVAGATVLLLVNSTLAHANIRMGTPGFDWFFTMSNQHRRHHSAVFEESNTNYACNAIIWDRLFGTYSSGPVRQTGIGPRQPRLREMLWLPFREPADVDTVATRADGAHARAQSPTAASRDQVGR
jgi:sterol desaturase/sphingolipid hydroxylase (fatty acid hydroxylase superfamily)